MRAHTSSRRVIRGRGTTSMQRAHNRGERGFALAAFAVSMTAFFALAAVAIDVGRIAHTANEVQNVADAAATAGATNLMNGGTASTARSDAQTVVAQNAVAGSTASIQTADLQVGQYNPTTNVFTNGATPANAVKATPSATVQNLFAGFFGSSFKNTTISKTATAGFVGLGEATPTLPLAIGACNFQSLQSCFATPGCLPKFTQAPSGSDNTGWIKTGNYLPTCCGGNPTSVSVGDSLSLSNGQMTSTLKDVASCFNSGFTEYVVPIVDGACDANFNQSRTVVGFATVVVTAVQSTGGNKGITLGAIFQQVSGPPGGGAYGTGSMRLFN
jgi:Flp pilus assembly protein TadG